MTDKVVDLKANDGKKEVYNWVLTLQEKVDIDADAMQNGPVMNRSCTDCICCLIFIAFVTGMAATGAYGFARGNPKLLLTTYDADGKYRKLETLGSN